MNISLNLAQEEFIKTQIEKGKYTDAYEVITAAFKVLEEKEKQLEELHQKKNGSQMVQDDSDDTLIKDFLKISESALNEYWLDEEEDEAWKNL
ncbi:ribbon-helix-helix domain-containing protein [Iningainema tapete]|uniref:Type II toxin-antitoxin system ParD family antitoxin n=1 Tax=Iningainema tapete BLCC-T55 TaxID=2748662 RepID=A0A8J7BWE6_9CYAN|nr:type II toxin-antitoxin system ParD family antitoxin [Iningainema tapete]MBD2770823.1 type II toxin-antitoxin system ParD family antitoxin [Iningainema tapete BLCC-T55]